MLGRLSALTVLAMMLACGGDPAPLDVKKPKSERSSDEARAERKRKRAEERKRKEQEEADAREAEERKERMRKRESEGEDAQEPRVADRDEPARSEDADEQERRERKERIRKREEAEAKKAKAAEAKAKKNKKKKNVEEVEDADEEVADEEPTSKKSKKNVEEADESEEEVAADDEPKTSPFKKKEPKQTAAQKKAAEKKAAAEAKLAEKKAADEAKKQAAADKRAAAKEAAEARAAEKRAAADKKAADEANKKLAEDADADQAEEEPAEEEEPKKVAKTDKRKSKSKAEEPVDESEIEVDTASLPPPDPSEESNELDLTAGTPTRDEEPVEVAPKTFAIDRRPLTLGRGKIDVHGGLVATAVTAPNGMGGTTTASAQGLALGATYGIGAKGELGFDYTLSLHPGDLQGPLMFHGAYVAKQTEKLDIALSLGLAFDFVDSVDPATMMTTTRTAKGLQVGIWARYHLGAKLSAFSGLPALPSSAGSLGKTAPLPPIPYQLSIGLSSVDAIALDIPAGLGYQATPKLYAFGVLDLAHLGMSNSTSAVVFSDFIPISLGGFYAASKMDIGAVFSDDLKQGADYLRFDVVVRYSIK